YLMVLTFLVFIIAAFVFGNERNLPFLIPCVIGALLILPGFMVIEPNEARVLTLFGDYKGTIKANGFFWANPLMLKRPISMRSRNLNGQSLKVNDKMGNPIEIAAVIVWQVSDTAKAVFEVNDFSAYVSVQSEAAVRH
ncbi:MAG: SPFH domain-containing protein, partial [Flavobacteriales bacterium]